MLKKIHSVAIYVVGSFLLVMATDALAIETGLASYYADKFQGRKTANGERYDRNKLTAAHRTLPMGSKIEIVNLKTKNSVIVTINDRGPYSGNRKLDLSYAAAKELGLVIAGVAPVSYEVVKPEKDSDFEKIIPLEYSPGLLGLPKSEEEVIEAEEELVLAKEEASNNTPPAVETATEPKAEDESKVVTQPHKKNKPKSEKTVKVSKTKTRNTADTNKTVNPKKTPKSEKSTPKSRVKPKSNQA